MLLQLAADAPANGFSPVHPTAPRRGMSRPSSAKVASMHVRRRNSSSRLRKCQNRAVGTQAQFAGDGPRMDKALKPMTVDIVERGADDPFWR